MLDIKLSNLLDFTIAFISWYVILLIISYIVYKFKKSTHFKRYNLFSIITALIIGILALFISANSNSQTNTSYEAAKYQLKEFISIVVNAPLFLEPETHSKFWKLVEELEIQEQDLDKFRYLLTGYAMEYNKLFFTDALRSLKEKKPYKSPERARYETQAIEDGIVTESIIIRNDENIKKISKQEPINYLGEPVVLNEEIITSTLKDINESILRLEVLFTKPENVRIEGSTAFLKWDVNKVKEVLPNLLATYGKNPDDPILNANLAWAYNMLGKYDLALKYTEKAMALKHDLAEVNYAYGVINSNLGNDSEAIKYYLESIKLKPAFEDAYFNLGVSYGNVGKLNQELEAYNKALQLNPRSSKTYTNLGIALGKLNKIEESKIAFSNAIETDSNNKIAFNNLGMIYFDQGRFSEAINAFENVIRISPLEPNVYANLGSIYKNIGKTKKSVEAFKKAIELDPNIAEFYYYLSINYLELENHKEGFYTARKATKLKPAFPEAHYLLGLHALQLDKDDIAAEEYEILKDLNAELSEKLNELIQLKKAD